MELGDGDPEGGPEKGVRFSPKGRKACSPLLTSLPIRRGLGPEAAGRMLTLRGDCPGPLPHRPSPPPSIRGNRHHSPAVSSAQGRLQGNSTCTASSGPPCKPGIASTSQGGSHDPRGEGVKSGPGSRIWSVVAPSLEPRWPRRPAFQTTSPSRRRRRRRRRRNAGSAAGRPWVPRWERPLTSGVTLDERLSLRLSLPAWEPGAQRPPRRTPAEPGRTGSQRRGVGGVRGPHAHPGRGPPRRPVPAANTDSRSPPAARPAGAAPT